MELRNIVAAMAYARARKPLVVILEGVNDRDFVGAVSRLLHASYSCSLYSVLEGRRVRVARPDGR